MKDVTAVIVTWQSAEVVGRAIDSCLQAGCDVIVVDNASTDDTTGIVRSRPAARLIANQDNRGFAAAVNQGFRTAGSPFILLLNPDAVPDTGVELLRDACRDPKTGAATGQLTDEQGHFQRGFSFRRLPTPASLAFEALGINRMWRSNPVNRRYRCLDMDPLQAAYVEQPAGAFLMIRRDVWKLLKGFDENFRPVWFEDVDFCKRLLENGFRIRYEPAARARHLGGHSISGLDWADKEGYWYGSLLYYARKHFRGQGLSPVCLAVAGGALLRMGTGIFLHRNTKGVPVYAKVIRLAFRHLFFPGGDVPSTARKY